MEVSKFSKKKKERLIKSYIKTVLLFFFILVRYFIINEYYEVKRAKKHFYLKVIKGLHENCIKKRLKKVVSCYNFLTYCSFLIK